MTTRYSKLTPVCLCIMMLLSVQVFAQGNNPPPEVTTTEVNTNYAQHEDFKPSLVSRLTVPSGFEVFVAASGLAKPRMMTTSGEGYLYVTRRDVGDVLLLKDLDGDDKFDELQTIVVNFSGAHGIAIHDGWLYVCGTKKLARGRLNSDGTVGALDTLINDLPDGGQHNNRTIDFGPDGKLYISIGSDCNDCRESNPEHATLLQANADGTERKIFARNLRNTIGFDWHPTTGDLWGMDHGTDWKGDTLPPEELNRIVEGKDYGWPLVFGKQQVDYTREDPQGTTKEAYAVTTRPAILTFPAHSAPMNFKFLSGNAFPSAYQNSALVTWHGSWNRKQPTGFKVQRILYESGHPTTTQDFLTGFFNPAKRSRFGRPVGITIAATGSIFISDDANGIIYCVRKIGTHRAANMYSKK